MELLPLEYVAQKGRHCQMAHVPLLVPQRKMLAYLQCARQSQSRRGRRVYTGMNEPP